MPSDALSSSPRSTAPSLGTVVSGKFRITRVLGEGGMGLVLEASHLQLEERVALKFLKPEALELPDVMDRFSREARSAVKLKCEYIARVIDVGDHAGLPYMVMEYLEGRNLEETLGADGPLEVVEAVELVIQACDGLAEAHARGIVHRDVKPANLFLMVQGDGRRSIKLLDFGISKAALTGDASNVSLGVSQTTSIMGSPHYMSPEQIRSTRDVDRRTDIWALGAVMFELLTGETPFRGEQFTELVAEILEKPSRDLAALRPDAPEELVEVVLRCLEKDPAKRFQTAGELALALLPFARSGRAHAAAASAVGVTRSSGLDPSLPNLSASPPARPSAAGAGMPRSSGAYRAPRVPSELSTAATLAPPTTTLVSVAATSDVAPPPPPARRWAFAAIALFLLGALGVAAVVLGQRGAPASPAAAAAAPAPAPPPAPTAEQASKVEPAPAPTHAGGSPSPSPSPGSEPAPATAAVEPSTPARPRPTTRSTPATPSGPRRPVPSASAAPAPTNDLEIRRQR